MDKISEWYELGRTFESRAPILFIFLLQNILQSNWKFLASYGPSNDLKSLIGLLLVSFNWLGEKILLKHLLIGGGTFVPPCPDGVDIVYV